MQKKKIDFISQGNCEITLLPQKNHAIVATRRGHNQVSLEWASPVQSGLEHSVLLLWAPEAAAQGGGV